MALLKNVIYAVAATSALLIGGLVGMHWLANKVPTRPKAVAQNAAFLWAPAVGFPGGLPRRGWWLACWENHGHDHCRLSDIDGNTQYQGEFVPYGGKAPLSSDQLEIDTERTTEHKVWIGSELVPLVYLKNGEILVPASGYDEAKRLLESGQTGPR
jgi:hypothetical protein